MPSSAKRYPMNTPPSELPPPPRWMVISTHHKEQEWNHQIRQWQKRKGANDGVIRTTDSFDKVRKFVSGIYQKSTYVWNGAESRHVRTKIEDPRASLDWKVYEWLLDPTKDQGGAWFLYDEGTMGDSIDSHPMLAKRKRVPKKPVAEEEIAAVIATIPGLAATAS